MAVGKDKQRVMITLNDKTVELLDKLAEITGSTRSEVLGDAVYVLWGVALGYTQIVTKPKQKEGENKA